MKKYIAPIVITAIAIIYALVMTIGIFVTMAFRLAAVVILVVPLGIAALFVTVLVLRIKEIKGGEEDAASKY